jgi:oligosaccharide reducing-end xylanase
MNPLASSVIGSVRSFVRRHWASALVVCVTAQTLTGCCGTCLGAGCACAEADSPEAGEQAQTATVTKKEPDKIWAVDSSGLTESQGAFFTGTHRNVFLELGKPQEEIDQKLKLARDTYFSATDPDRLYYEFDADEAYILDVAHEDIRSEGQSYGMMIAVQLGDKERFDKLWNFAVNHMRINDPKHPSYRGFGWVLETTGTICDENSAPDGEEYFAMSLYFAHNRWGSSATAKAAANYKFWADEILDMMKNREKISGSRKRRMGSSDGKACKGKEISDQLTSEALFDADQRQIQFNATVGQEYTDPSYHLPAFYNLFALWGPQKDAAFWNSAAATSRAFFGRAMNASTGLASEYSKYDGSPHRVSFNSLSAKFAYDAWRVGGNVGMDWAWMAQPGSEEQARADALVSFFHGQGVSEYLALWNVDGTGGNGHHSPGLIAMNAVATLAATDAIAEQSKAMVEELWNTQLPRGKYRYYDGLLYTFAMLHLSGHYKIHKPADAAAVAPAAK